MQRIEIVGERRRAHDAAFRARVVAECMVPGTRVRVRVQELATPAWHLHTSLIYRWRRVAAPQAGAGRRFGWYRYGGASRGQPKSKPRRPDRRPKPDAVG